MEDVKKMEELSRQRIIYIIDNFCGGERMELARRAGIGKSSISQYVNGSNAPGSITASKIGKAFGLDPMWVMGFDVPMVKAAADDAMSPTDLQILEAIRNLSDDDKRTAIKLLKALSK